jgi:hypothetical protein
MSADFKTDPSDPAGQGRHLLGGAGRRAGQAQGGAPLKFRQYSACIQSAQQFGAVSTGILPSKDAD